MINLTDAGRPVPASMTKAQIEKARTLIIELHSLEDRQALAMEALMLLCADLNITHGGHLAAIEGRLASEIGKQILAKGML